MIHLDTSYLVDLLREARRDEEGPAIRHLGEELAEVELAVSVHVVCELLAATRRSGHPVSTMDLLIGTSAIVHEAPLVTGNPRDFRRIPGLDVIEYGEAA